MPGGGGEGPRGAGAEGPEERQSAGAAAAPPKTFVLRRGEHAGNAALKRLEQDLRQVLAPHTARNLKQRKANSLKDFVHVAGPLGVTHFVMLSTTDLAHYVRVARIPRGPTLVFRVRSWSSCADVSKAAAQYRAPPAAFNTPPLLVMANFGKAEHMALATALFQSMFPSINARTVRLPDCRRVVLLRYDEDTKVIAFRHYSISAAPTGVSKSVRGILKRNFPDLGHLQDVSEFVAGQGYGSESEGEDTAVLLAQDYSGRGNLEANKSKVKLHEMGPRLDLELVKIEEGLCQGAVLYHGHIDRTPEEVLALEAAKQDKEALRKRRRAEQEENVRKKEALKRQKESAKAEARQKKAARKAAKAKREAEAADGADDGPDDAAFYEMAVGEAPDRPLDAAPPGRGKGKKPGRDGKKHNRKRGSTALG